MVATVPIVRLPKAESASGHAPTLPDGEWVDLPRRGRLFVRRVAGPPDAPTLILQHGWTVTSDLNWFPSIDALAQHFTVVSHDHRGHGRGIRSPRRFTMKRCADDTIAVADHLGIDRFVPVGYSMGGAVAQLIWRRHPERISGLVLAATAARFKVTKRHRWEFPTLTTLSWATRVLPDPARRPVLGRLIQSRTRDRGLHPWIIEEIRSSCLRAITEAGSQIGRFDSRAWISSVDVPTAVITTGADTLVPTSGQLALARLLPQARHWHLDGATHDVCVTGADRFVPILLEACRHVTER